MNTTCNNPSDTLHKAGITDGFIFPLGSTPEEKITGLQAIKDSMVNCMMNALNDDLGFERNTITWIQSLYMQADVQIHKLQKKEGSL